MSVTYCDFSDLPDDQCAHCLGVTASEPDDEPDGHVFPAKFAGVCRRCEGPIYIGVSISPAASGYVHAMWEDCG